MTHRIDRAKGVQIDDFERRTQSDLLANQIELTMRKFVHLPLRDTRTAVEGRHVHPPSLIVERRSGPWDEIQELVGVDKKGKTTRFSDFQDATFSGRGRIEVGRKLAIFGSIDTVYNGKGPTTFIYVDMKRLVVATPDLVVRVGNSAYLLEQATAGVQVNIDKSGSRISVAPGYRVSVNEQVGFAIDIEVKLGGRPIHGILGYTVTGQGETAYYIHAANVDTRTGEVTRADAPSMAEALKRLHETANRTGGK